MTNAIRHTLLWNLTLGVPMPLDADVPPEWQREIEALIADRRARVNGQQALVARPHPGAATYTPEAAASIAAWCRLILFTLEADGAVDARTWPRRGAAFGLNPDHLKPARQWLLADGLARTTDGVTRAVHPAPERPRPLTPARVGLVPVAPAAPVSREPVAGRARLARPEPVVHAAPAEVVPVVEAPATPAPAPPAPDTPAPDTPEPKPVVEAPATPAPLAPAPRPARPPRVRREPVHTDTATELLARIAVAAEMQTRIATAAATRVRTPLGVSPLLDAQRRIAVVLAAAEAPMTASALTLGHLTPQQRDYRDAALADGVANGVFAATGGGITGRGARYILRDPAPLDTTWAEVNAAAEEIRARREARRARQAG